MEFNIQDSLNFQQSNILVQYTQELYQTQMTHDMVGNLPLHQCLIKQLNYPGHYRTLAYFSTLFDNELIIELGSNYGISALALSYNSSNQVISYDIRDQNQSLIKKHNLEFRIENIIPSKLQLLLDAKLIFIDVAPHDGIQEQIILDYLINNNYQGITIWDDIHYGSPTVCNETQKFWDNITIPKHDISRCRKGNVGLGVIDFTNRIKIT